MAYETSQETIDTEQLTFNGLARQAMVIGVPITALAVCGFVGVMAVMIAMPFLQGKALLFILLPAPIIAFIHTACKNDDQALRIILYECKWFLRRRNAKLFNNTTTILATKYGRQIDDYQRFFDQCIKKSTSRHRFSTEDLPTRYK